MIYMVYTIYTYIIHLVNLKYKKLHIVKIHGEYKMRVIKSKPKRCCM